MKTTMGLLVASALALSACSKGKEDDAPTGQVVATLNGDEITVADVQAEIGDPAQASTPELQSQALQRIVARKLLAAEARRRELDGTPLASILTKRAEDDALAQLLSRKVLEGTPKVSDNEIQEFLRTYPASVTQRRIINVDSLLVPKATPQLAEKLKALHTLGDAEALLSSQNVKYQKSGSVIDTLTLEPSFAAKLIETEGRDIFMVPQGDALQIGQIASSRAARSARLDGLSSPINSPAFSCARARATSASVMSSEDRFSSSSVRRVNSPISSSEVPA